MPRFKRKSDEKVVEVDEEHANQVLRKQSAYEELSEGSKTYELKHKGFGKYNILNQNGEEMYESPFTSKEEAENARAEML